MGNVIRPVPPNVLAPEELRNYLITVKNAIEVKGDAVADTIDVSDTATQLNALLAQLRAIGIIKN